MRHVSYIAGAVLALAAIGCSSMRIQSDFDPEAAPNFGAYRTYAWLPHPQGGDVRINNELVARRISGAVDRELAVKGYQKQDSGSPSFKIGYHAAVEGRLDVDRVNSYYGYGWGRWGRPGGVVVSTDYVREYNEGTLILDIVDGESGELVWRGSAEAEIDMMADPQQRQEKINTAVQRILERFPPQP